MRKIQITVAGSPGPHKGTSIGHKEYCNDPKCRGNCSPSKEVNNLLDNLEANLKRAIENASELMEQLKGTFAGNRARDTRDSLKKLLTSSTEEGSIPSIKSVFK
jgi:hypothetical protein